MTVTSRPVTGPDVSVTMEPPTIVTPAPDVAHVAHLAPLLPRLGDNTDLPPLIEALRPPSDPEAGAPITDHHVSWKRVLAEWAIVIVGAFAVFWLINSLWIQAFKIPSESMVPTLEIGDRVLVNKLSYDFHDLNRGDVIVFKRPPNAVKNNADDPDDLIKRVIGLPGERVVARDGHVYINDRQLIEPYLPSGTITDNLDTAVTVPPGKVFVMGDNRANSADSRFIGPIDSDLVIGRAFATVWPLNRMGSL